MTKDNIPQLTEEQRLKGVARSAAVRKRNAAYKARLKSGEMTLEEFIKNEDTQNIKVYDMLSSMPHIGKARASKIMRKLNISKTTRVKGMGYIQKHGLLEMFR